MINVPQRAQKLVDDLNGEGYTPEEVTDIIAAAFVDVLITAPTTQRQRALDMFMAMMELAADDDTSQSAQEQKGQVKKR